MKTTVPDLCCLMYGRTALVTLMRPKKFTWNCSMATFDLRQAMSHAIPTVTLCKAAYPPSSMMVFTPYPALFTSTSMRPQMPTAAATLARMLSSLSVTSRVMT